MIGELINQKTKLKKIGQDGLELIKDKYVWSKILDDLKKIMISLIRKLSNISYFLI